MDKQTVIDNLAELWAEIKDPESRPQTPLDYKYTIDLYQFLLSREQLQEDDEAILKEVRLNLIRKLTD